MQISMQLTSRKRMPLSSTANATPIYTALQSETRTFMSIAFFWDWAENLFLKETIHKKDDRIQANSFRSNISIKFMAFTFMALKRNLKIFGIIHEKKKMFKIEFFIF